VTPRQTEAAIKLAAGVAAIVLLKRFVNQQALALGLPMATLALLISAGSIALAKH
jgi:hypothetical protein